MSEPERPRGAADPLLWLRFARDDLELAGEMASDAARTHYACWFSQQAAEKAMKALLVLEGIQFPYTHDLDSLLVLHDDWPLRAAQADLKRLTAWGAESRYPDDWPEFSREEAARAVAEARAVYDSIAAEFRRRGAVLE